MLHPRNALTAGALILSMAALLAAEPAAPPDRPDPWRSLRPLLGKWQGTVKGEPGVGKAEREYAFILSNRFVSVTNRSIYPPKENNAQGETHEDIGFISYDRSAKKLVLRQFHIEGFVNQYVLDQVFDDGRTFVFTSTAIENIAPGWRAREAYQIVSEDEFIETFSLAEPGKEFAAYSETRFHRVKAAAKKD